MSQDTRLWYLSFQQAAKAETSLHKCSDLPEPSQLKQIRDIKEDRPTFTPLVPLDTSAWVVKEGFGHFWIITKSHIPTPGFIQASLSKIQGLLKTILEFSRT